MRLNYMDYQIVYLEDTGDASVYRNNKEIIYAYMDKGLSSAKVIESMSLCMNLPQVKKRLSMEVN